MPMFLVVGEATDPDIAVALGANRSPSEAGSVIEQVIVPSLESLAKMEEEKKISGGVFAGERKGAFILNAPSHEEVGKLLSGLPFWGIVKWDVKPLQSFRSAAQREKNVARGLKAAPTR